MYNMYKMKEIKRRYLRFELEYESFLNAFKKVTVKTHYGIYNYIQEELYDKSIKIQL